MRIINGKMKSILVSVLSLVLAIGVLSGCTSGNKDQGGNTGSNATANTATTLNIAVQPVVGYLPVYLLRDSGSLEKALKDAGYDIEITFVEFESGPPENEAFASKQVDLGVMGNVPAISGIANGQSRSIIGIAYNGEQTEAIVVRNDSEITDASQLKGAKIGLVVGSIAQNYLSVLLENNGLSLADVEIVNLSPGEQQQALENKLVDAVATWEPTISKLTTTADNRILADGTGIFLGENPIVGRTEYINENPDIVRIFLEEYAKAAELIKSDVPSYAAQYSEKFLLDQSIVEAALSHAELPIVITDKDVEDLQGTAEFLYGEGLISKELTISDYVIYEIK